MFLPYFARLLTLNHRPFISYILIGLFAGISVTGIYSIGLHIEESNRIEVEQATPTIANQFPKLVFENSARDPNTWMRSVHFMMSRKAAEKFDRIFLPYGTQIYQSGKISLVPEHALLVPNVSQNRISQVIQYEKRGTRVSKRIALIEVSKNDMRYKEFTLDLKLRKKHGKVLIVDINVSPSEDGTTYEEFLKEANSIENAEQFNKNLVVSCFYAPDYFTNAPRLNSDLSCVNMALEYNPKFCLGHLQSVRCNIYEDNLRSAEMELSEAKRTASGPECARMIAAYESAIKYVRDGKSRASKLPPLTVHTNKANPKLKAAGFAYPNASAK